MVSALPTAGCHDDEITILCSDEAKQRNFRDFQFQSPAGRYLSASTAAGGATGATLGGLAPAAIGLTTGVFPVAIIGAAGALTGGVVGSLLGAFLSRGTESEAADF